jgi:hypothetical protein
LTSNQFTASNNANVAEDQLTISAVGTFTFDISIPNGKAYDVTIDTNSLETASCSLSGTVSGIISADTVVTVVCKISIFLIRLF